MEPTAREAMILSTLRQGVGKSKADRERILNRLQKQGVAMFEITDAIKGAAERAKAVNEELSNG